jgi:hypothetical protein
MLVSGLLRAMEQERSFLGLETERATAVLITEEDEMALVTRARQFGLLDLRSTYVSRNSGALALAWPELISKATEQAIRAGHRLLVIDTFPGLAGLQDEQENDAGAINARLAPLQRAAGKGLAVLFLHHVNSQGQPRGSKAFKGISDISIRLLRSRSSSSFTLETESRFPTTPARVRGQLDRSPRTWRYQGLGKTIGAEQVADSADERLMAALSQAGSSGLTYAEVDGIPGLSKDMAKKRFPGWHAANKINRRGTGTKTDPYRWLRPAGPQSGAVRGPLKEVIAPNPY